MAHRMSLRPELWGSRATSAHVVREIVVTAALVLAVAMDWQRPPAAPPPVHTTVTPDIIREGEEALLTPRGRRATWRDAGPGQRAHQ